MPRGRLLQFGSPGVIRVLPWQHRLPERGSQVVGEGEAAGLLMTHLGGPRCHVHHVLLVKQVTRLKGRRFDPTSCLSLGPSSSLHSQLWPAPTPHSHTGCPPSPAVTLRPQSPASTPLPRLCLPRRPSVSEPRVLPDVALGAPSPHLPLLLRVSQRQGVGVQDIS